MPQDFKSFGGMEKVEKNRASEPMGERQLAVLIVIGGCSVKTLAVKAREQRSRKARGVKQGLRRSNLGETTRERKINFENGWGEGKKVSDENWENERTTGINGGRSPG